MTTEIRYYMPNLKSNNAYDARTFSVLDEEAIKQIKADIECIKQYQKSEIKAYKKCFQGKTHSGSFLRYYADCKEREEDVEVEGSCIIIMNDKGQQVQYNREAFKQVTLFEHDPDLMMDRLMDQKEEKERKPARKTVIDLSGPVEFASIFEEIRRFFAEICGKLFVGFSGDSEEKAQTQSTVPAEVAVFPNPVHVPSKETSNIDCSLNEPALPIVF